MTDRPNALSVSLEYFFPTEFRGKCFFFKFKLLFQHTKCFYKVIHCIINTNIYMDKQRNLRVSIWLVL